MPEGKIISIHAPHGGSDSVFISCPPSGYISIHAPRGGSDPKPPPQPLPPQPFQSTLPVGGATCCTNLGYKYLIFQSTLPVGGATRNPEHDVLYLLFQSTLPVGGATYRHVYYLPHNTISIHAPRGGSDAWKLPSRTLPPYFNPRSPQGERQLITSRPFNTTRFQSTLPAGGATDANTHNDQKMLISIHAPRRGSDLRVQANLDCCCKISIHAPRRGSDWG